MKRITSRVELLDLMGDLGVSSDWHEPDEQRVTVKVAGVSFDSAGYWPDGEQGGARLERHVILKKRGKPVAAVNLATLFAWATGYDN